MNQATDKKEFSGQIYYLAPVAISAGLFYLSTFISPVWFLAPVPLYIGFAMHGYPVGALLALVSAGLLSLVLDGAQAMLFISTCGFIALGLAYSFHQKIELPKAAVVSTAIAFVAIILFFALYVSTQGYSPISMISEWANEHVGAVIEAYHRIESEEPIVGWLSKNQEAVAAFLALISPALLFCVVYVAVLADLAIISIVAERSGLDIALSGKKFGQWRAPGSMALIFLASGLSVILLSQGTLYAIAINLLLIFGAIYVALGLSVILYFMEKWKVPGLFITIGLFIIIAQPQFLFMALICGLIDVLANFRRIDTLKEQQNET